MSDKSKNDVDVEELVENINKFAENMIKAMQSLVPYFTMAVESITEWWNGLPPEIREEILKGNEKRKQNEVKL